MQFITRYIFENSAGYKPSMHKNGKAFPSGKNYEFYQWYSQPIIFWEKPEARTAEHYPVKGRYKLIL